MRATASFIRNLIRGLAWDSQASGIPFRETLQAAAHAKLTETSRGKILIGVTAGGTSSSYIVPVEGNSYSAADIQEAFGLILDQVEALDAENDPVLGDDVLPVELRRLNPTIREAGRDFRGLASCNG